MVGFLKDFIWARLMFLNIHHLKKPTHFVLISKSNMLVTAITKKKQKKHPKSCHSKAHMGLNTGQDEQIIFKED